MATKQELEQKALEKRASDLMDQMTNKNKREAIKFFNKPYEELDDFDSMVVLALVADRVEQVKVTGDPNAQALHDIAYYDSLPMGELQKVVTGK